MEVNNRDFSRESGIVELDENPCHEFYCFEDSPWECLERLRDELTSNVDVTRLVPRLRACRVITHCEEDEIFSDLQLKNCRLRMGRLLDILYTKGEKGIQALFDSLERYYPELYHELTGKESTFRTQSEPDAAPQWLLTELLNEKRLSCELKSTVAALERQQRLNLQDLQQSTDKQNIIKTENQEQQEELAKVKEENRELRVQFSSLAQEKMALQLKCRELQFEEEQALQALRWAHTDCETERRQSQRLRRDRDLQPSSSTVIDLERQNAKLQAKLSRLSKDFSSQQNSNTKEQEQLDQLFNLRQELQNTQEHRDQLLEEKSATDIKSEALIEDCLVFQKRIKSLHVELSEVEKEREQALAWRDEAQAMYSQCMQEKDRYRRQVRELEEKIDSLQHIISKAESTLFFDRDKLRCGELSLCKSEPNLCYKSPTGCSSPTESNASSSDLSTVNICSTSLPDFAFRATKKLQMKAPSESCLSLLLSSTKQHQSLRWKMGSTYFKSFVPDNATENASCTSSSSPWPCSTTLLTSMNHPFSDNSFLTKYMPDDSVDLSIQCPVPVPRGSPNSHSPVPVPRGSPNSHSPVPVPRGSPNSHSPVPVPRGSPSSHSPLPGSHDSLSSHSTVPVPSGSPNHHSPVPVPCGSPSNHSPLPVSHGSASSHSPVSVPRDAANSQTTVNLFHTSINSQSAMPISRGSPNSHSPVPVPCGSPNSRASVYRGFSNSQSQDPVLFDSSNSQSPVILLTNHPTVLRRTPCLSPSQTQAAGFWISSSPSNVQSEPNRPLSYRPVLQLTVPGPGCLKDQLNITGGNNLGIFVAAVQTDSAANGAGLRPQHQILALEADFGSGRDTVSLESCTKEEASWRLSRCCLPARVSVKHNPDGFMALGSTLRGGDSFYIRLNMELCPKLDGNGSLEASIGEILHVTDTLPQVVSWEISADGEDSEGCGFWAAEKIDDRQHEPIKNGIIPNYKSAQKLLMNKTAYSRSDFKHKRSWWRWWLPPQKVEKGIPKSWSTQQLPSIARDADSDDLCLKENEQPVPYMLVSPRQPTYQRPVVLVPELVSEALGGILSMNPGFRMLSPVEVGDHSSVMGKYKKESVCREESFVVARLLKTKVNKVHLVLHGGLRMAWFLRKADIHPIILFLHLTSKGRKPLRKRLLEFPFGDKVLVKRLQEEEILLWASFFQFVLVNPEETGSSTTNVVQLLVKKAQEEQERTVWVSPFTN